MTGYSLSLFLLFAAMPSWAAAPTAVENKRALIVQKLRAQKYFKSSTCSEVASEALKKFGLPPLGHTTPLRGKRGPFVRAKKPQLLPVLRDEIHPSGPEMLDIQVQMLSLDKVRPPQWRIHVVRSGKVPLKSGVAPVSLETDFNFVLQSHSGHDICELSGIAFKLNNKPADKSLKPEQVTVRECIDLFLVSTPQNSEELGWIKADCAFALHYAPAALAKL